MRFRSALTVALASALFAAAAYQRPVAYRVRFADGQERGYALGFGSAGATRAMQWRWSQDGSRIVFRNAGQIVPGAQLALRVGLPAEAGPGPRRVSLSLNGSPLAEFNATGDFRARDFPVDSRAAGPGEWELSIGGEMATDGKGVSRGVAVVRAELASGPFPVLPPLRTLALSVLAAVALFSLLKARLPDRVALGLALASAFALSLGVAFAREPTVVLVGPVAMVMTAVAFVAIGRRSQGVSQIASRLAGAAGGWSAALAAPFVALAGLVLVALGGDRGLGVALLGLGIAVSFLRVTATPAETAPAPASRWVWTVIAVVTMVGLAFRLYRLEEVPFAIFRDEARHGILALRLLSEPTYRPLFVGPPINQPLPYFLAVAEAIRFFGTNLFALRVVSAVAGAAVVPLLFRLVRAVLGPREAFVAALLLAVSSWHVSISRFAVNYVEPSLFSLPAYLLLWRSLPQASPVGLCLAALLVGLGQYSAHTAKALFLVAAGLVVDEVVQRLVAKDRPGLRKLAVACAAGAAVGLVSVAPVISFLRENSADYLARARQVSVWSQASPGHSASSMLVENLFAYGGAFHLSGDPNGRHHLPGAPLLDPLSGLGLLAGLCLVLAKLSSRSHRFLLLWLLAGLFPGLVTVDAPSALRIVEASPAIYAIAALGLVSFWRCGRGVSPRAWKAVAASILAAAVLWNAWIYFLRMYDSPSVWRRFAPIATHLGKQLQSLREAGTLAGTLHLVAPRQFIDDPDTRYVLQFYWPQGLELGSLEETSKLQPADALAVPNLGDYWGLVARREARYAANAAEAKTNQSAWAARIPLNGTAIVGPFFPATDRPTFWLYLPAAPNPARAEDR